MKTLTKRKSILANKRQIHAEIGMQILIAQESIELEQQKKCVVSGLRSDLIEIDLSQRSIEIEFRREQQCLIDTNGISAFIREIFREQWPHVLSMQSHHLEKSETCVNCN